MKLHIHFNHNQRQECALKESLEVGKTATVHLHDAPDDCQICMNGHCHAPNLSVSLIDENTLFVAFEQCGLPDKNSFVCDMKDLPPHPSFVHEDQG